MKTSAALFTLNRIWQGFLRFLVNASELRVWQVSDGHGHTYWRAYDPVSGRSSYREHPGFVKLLSREDNR
ncbi:MULTISPECIES: hypothetical protein [Cyanophyceae]|uniref:hypothetical protein n=1 Tax=Cyanophyceae TaxID=3028117 RepID=UPI00168916E6|nr:hypothetical protein [Trichocoleus sp. FACHB-40]MBD2003709.1 hypothetical protein [Trichocoleus sp. FACHB-40]